MKRYQNIKKPSKLVKNCRQETLSKISNRIFSSGWSGNPDFFLPMTIYIEKSVFRDLVCIPRWPTAFKTWRIRFRNFQRFSFMCMYRFTNNVQIRADLWGIHRSKQNPITKITSLSPHTLVSKSFMLLLHSAPPESIASPFFLLFIAISN